MVFVELPIFSRCAQALFSDAQLRDLQQVLLENPSVGDLIPGGRGLRKFHVALLGRGKRGGARVIYYHWVSREQCYLIYAYAKNARADLTKDQLRRLAEVIETEVSNG